MLPVGELPLLTVNVSLQSQVTLQTMQIHTQNRYMCNFLYKKGLHKIHIALHFPLLKYYSMAAIIYVCGYKNTHIFQNMYI